MSCTACPLHAAALTVCVAARGPDDAKVLIVGQNPGQEENLEGRAFVGKSGRLLDAMLADAGFDPQQVRMTNAVRCVTPDNRVPFPSEMNACSPHLKAEIAAVRPDVIIAMGEVALKALVGNIAISKVRGQDLKLKSDFDSGAPVYVTYHPAYVLRQTMARNTVVADLRRVRDRQTKQTEQTWTPWRPQILPIMGAIAYDIETYNAEGQITDSMTQAAIATNDGAFVSINRIDDMLKALEGQTVVSHNGWVFDDPKTGIRSDYDTRAMAYLDDETQPLGLESLCVKHFGVRGWKEDKGANLGTAELAEYNARDAVYTLRLFRYYLEVLGDRIKILDYIMRPARLALDAISARGVWIDPEAVEIARIETQKLLDERRAAVLLEVEECGFPADFFNRQLKTKVKEIPFNPNSNDHVGTLLTWLGFKLPLTKEGDPKTDKETLVYLDHPFCRALELYREVAKKMSTYVVPYGKIAAVGDGRAHSTFGIYLVTGRSSSSKPNVQNLDRDLKKIKNAPPGRVLLAADYSSVEFRMGAFIAGEQTIVANYRSNASWDPHTWFASRLYGFPVEEITKDSHERQEAKSANFSQCYMGDGNTLRDYLAREMGMFVTRARGTQIHKAWHAAFPGWKPWYDDVLAELLDKGYVESLTGRRRHYGDVSLLTKRDLLAACRECVNFKVQSFCADIAFIALGACNEANLPMVDFVHDDIKFEFASVEQAEQAKPLIQHCMVDEPLRVLREIFGIVPTVPLEIEFSLTTVARQETGVIDLTI